MITNRISQMGANDFLELDYSVGLGGDIAIIPETDPTHSTTYRIVYSGKEYDEVYAPFASLQIVPQSDNSLYSQSPIYTQPLSTLPQPDRVIYPNALYPNPYNNVSYSQLAEALGVLKSSTSYGSLTFPLILDTYRALFVVDPQLYLPLFDREYNILNNTSNTWLYDPIVPNNSLAYIIYYGL